MFWRFFVFVENEVGCHEAIASAQEFCLEPQPGFPIRGVLFSGQIVGRVGWVASECLLIVDNLILDGGHTPLNRVMRPNPFLSRFSMTSPLLSATHFIC